MSLREAQKEMTRRRLVDAAAMSFRERGYAATTIEDVANGAGATRATFYLHFRTKADLIAEVMGVVRADAFELNGRLEAVVRAGDRSSIREWLDAAFDFWEIVRPYAIAEEEAASLDADTRRNRSGQFATGTEAIVRGLVARDGGDEDEGRVRAVLAYAQLDSVFHRWMRMGWDIDRTTALEVMTDMWMTALGSKGDR